jgi:hypothetical protein
MCRAPGIERIVDAAHRCRAANCVPASSNDSLAIGYHPDEGRATAFGVDLSLVPPVGVRPFVQKGGRDGSSLLLRTYRCASCPRRGSRIHVIVANGVRATGDFHARGNLDGRDGKRRAARSRRMFREGERVSRHLSATKRAPLFLRLVLLLTAASFGAVDGASAKDSSAARSQTVTVQGTLMDYQVFSRTTLSGEIIDAAGVPHLFLAPLAARVHDLDLGRVWRLRGTYVTDAAGTPTLVAKTRAVTLGLQRTIVVRHAAVSSVAPHSLEIAARSGNAILNTLPVDFPAGMTSRLRAITITNAASLHHTFRLALGGITGWRLTSFT